MSQLEVERLYLPIVSSFPCLKAKESFLEVSHQFSCTESVKFYELHTASHQCDPGTCHTLQELKD